MNLNHQQSAIASIVTGVILFVGSFFYRGTYNTLFVHSNRKPDNPPTKGGRIVLLIMGIVFVAFGARSLID